MISHRTLLLLGILLIVGCQEDIVGPPQGTVSGFVWNSDGSPVEGVQITVIYDVPDGGGTLDNDLVHYETIGTNGPLLQGVIPSPHSSQPTVVYQIPEPGTVMITLYDQWGRRFFRDTQQYDTEHPPQVEYSIDSGNADDWRNGYYVLTLDFIGETVQSHELLYGLLRNTTDHTDATAQATTGADGWFSFPIADLAIGTMVHVTDDQEDEAATLRRVPPTVTVLAQAEGFSAALAVDLSSADHDHAIELTLTPLR